jgi:four helix bundle protein
LFQRVSDFKKLKVWRKAHALALNVHRVAGRIRGSKHAALRNQMSRAAMSIPTNLVEGAGQESGKEFARFISISLNSSSELEYHLIVGRDMRAIKISDFESLSSQTIEVRKMLYGLRNRVLVLPRAPRKQVPAS